jgi:hypothetical protein
MDIDVGRFEGLCIVRADSREDAERIACAKPYHKAGWRTNKVRSWQLYEGVLVDTVKALMVGPTGTQSAKLKGDRYTRAA